MKKFECSVAQNGFFAGPVFFIHSVTQDESIIACDIDEEIKNLRQAENTLRNSIREKQLSDKNSEIQGTVLSILDDEAFAGGIEQNIRSFSLSASSAVIKTTQELTSALNDVSSEYIRSRQDDIRGVANQLISILGDVSDTPVKCSAICASEISPAQLGSIDECLIGGILTDKGSPNSHTSILAGNMNIPYLYGSSEAVAAVQIADFIIMDSDTGMIITDPDEEMKNTALCRMEQIVQQKANERSSHNDIAVSSKTRVCANIGGPQDIKEVLESGADGIGLFRTELLFLNNDSIPTEEEQYEEYSSVLLAMKDKEVIIRTMDLGSDKKPHWLKLPDESNPALGLRGVRVSLEREDLFNTQLRALLRAAVKGNLKIMFPMIASSWEIKEAKDRLQEAANQLREQGEEYRIPPIGIMIETPAAAVCAEELAEIVDFFSIGTNDLTQYTIAIDREAQGLDRYFNPHHPSVFKLIGMAVDGGHKHGIEIGVCGQLASDPEAARKLIELGVDELSVAIRKVRNTKQLAVQTEKQIEEECHTKQTVFPSIVAPADGRLISMQDIPDPVFSEGTLGECFGILPSNGNVYSPVAGTVIAIASTGHAMTIKTDNGLDILVHVGINTVNLETKAFTHYVRIGERVEKDQLIMEADLDIIKKAGLSTIIVVIALK